MIEVVLVAVSVLHILAFILFVGSLRHVSPAQSSSSTDGVLSSLTHLVGKFERILSGVEKVASQSFAGERSPDAEVHSLIADLYVDYTFGPATWARLAGSDVLVFAKGAGMISPAGDVDPAGCPDPCFCSSLVQFLNWYRQLPSGKAMFTHLAAAAHLLKSGRYKLPDISANFGLVASLDVSTTGLQVFCLDPEHRAAVRSKLHEARKLYLVGVPSAGSLPEGQSVMTTLWMRQINDGLTSTVASSLHQRSGYSKTTCVFHSLRTAGNMTVIACELHQGFRHQIHQHAAFALRTPILGDKL